VDTNPRSWLSRALVAAITVAAIVWLLRWAWNLLRPLLPVLAGGLLIAATIALLIRYRRNRYW
jgi:hypothetical protein